MVRHSHLLTPETRWPLSIDQMLWPSIFYYPVYVDGKEYLWGSMNDEFTRAKQMVLEAHHWQHEALGLWQDLSLMKRFFSRYYLGKKDGVIVAVALYSGTLEPRAPDWNKDYWSAVLSDGLINKEIPSSFKLLGYDVADHTMTSGLVNCGYSKKELGDLKKLWPNKLNEYGLFPNLDDAVEYIEVCDRRVVEHAPFFAYGLYSENMT